MASNELKEKILDITGKIEDATDSDSEKEIWDSALDLVETLVEATPTKIDDFIVKPLIKIIRNRFKIADGTD